MTRDEKLKVQELRREGKGYRTIAQETGISVSTIASFCRKHGNDTFDVCMNCGTRLVQLPKCKKKKFCSDKCRMIWWKGHMDQVNRQAYYNAVCQHCGKEFVSYGNDHRKFCSRKCASDHRKKQ